MRRWQQIAAILAAAFIGVGLTACGDGDIAETEEGQLDVPDSLSFERIEVGGEAIQTLELRNQASAGNAPVVLDNFRIDQGQADTFREFQPVGDFPIDRSVTLEAGESISWDIAYRPENGNSDEGAITFDVDNNQDASQFTVELQTADMEPRISIDPQNVNFSTDPGESTLKYSVVRSSGQAPLDIDNLAITGSDKFSVQYADPSEVNCDPGRTSPFPEVEGPDRNNDGEPDMITKPLGDVQKITPSGRRNLWSVDGLQQTYAPGECFVVIYEFSPADNTPETAKVTLTTNADPATQSISLAGNSDAPCLEISTGDALRFGTVSEDSTATRVVRIRNCRPRADELLVRDIRFSNHQPVFEPDRATFPGSKLLDNDPNTAIALEGDEQITFTVQATPDMEGTIGRPSCAPQTDPVMRVLTNDSAQPEEGKPVCLVVSGDDNQCPTAVGECRVVGSSNYSADIDTLPLETIECTAQGSDDSDGSIQRYEWTILNRPGSSNARLIPNSSVSDPRLELDLVGTYVLELKVYDNEGAVSCGDPAKVTVEAIPDDDLLGQLIWDTPGDPNQNDDSGTDLDLHFVNSDFPSDGANWSWNQAPYDIYWDNQTEDWGIEDNPNDNPQLDVDDRDGAGPENISLDRPQFGKTYKYGVFYYLDNGFGESYATLRIFINGELAKEYKNKYLPDTDTFWYVADVEWQDENSRIFTRDIINENGFP
jgi:hypothetical protein